MDGARHPGERDGARRPARQAYPIDRDRIYLTGLSRGARGAIEFLANNPRTFAGALLAAARAENDDVSEVAKFARVPIWFTHAADDPVVPYQGSVDLANALEAAGTRVVRGEWAGDNSAGPAQDRAAETAARRLLQHGPRRLAVHDLHAGHRRRQPPLLVGADVRDGRDARLAVRYFKVTLTVDFAVPTVRVSEVLSAFF